MNDNQYIDVEVQEGVYHRVLAQPLDYDPETTKRKENYDVERITHVRADWVVIALIVGMAIGFIFGVAR